MAYTILLQRPDGNWTDYIGDAPNEWPTIEAADAAINSLKTIGFTGPWAIVQTHTLPHRDLVT